MIVETSLGRLPPMHPRRVRLLIDCDALLHRAIQRRVLKRGIQEGLKITMSDAACEILRNSLREEIAELEEIDRQAGRSE